MPRDVKVQVNFSREYNGIPYSDSLYFSAEDYAALSDEALTALEDERFNNWVQLLTNPPVAQPQPPTRKLTRFGFYSRFTDNERGMIAAIELSAETPVEVRAGLLDLSRTLSIAEEIDLDDPSTRKGIGFLQLIGVLTEERAAEMLS